MYRVLLSPAALALLAEAASKAASVGLQFEDDAVFLITGKAVVNLLDGTPVPMCRSSSGCPLYVGSKLARAAWILEHWLKQAEAGRTAIAEIDANGLKISVAAAGPTYCFHIPLTA